MAAITVSDLTEGQGSLNGTGVFDELMKAVEAHIKEEYSKGRIKGTEYATVYLGAVQSVMDRAMQFLLTEQKTDLEAQLLQEQITTEQKRQEQLDAQNQNLAKEGLQIEAQTALTEQQTQNATKEELVLDAQKCKLDAEFDNLQEQKLKIQNETSLLAQKKTTEKAQTDSTGLDPSSILGRQATLYKNQADGFIRDSEQKVAKQFMDIWSVQRTTDSGIAPNTENGLIDSNIGRAVDKLLAGVNA